MQSHKEVGGGCTISHEKDIVSIPSSSPSRPPQILQKETIILYCVHTEQ